MDLPLSSDLASRFDWLDECESTNTELVNRAADAWPHFSVVATDTQTAGRGRLDRAWVTPSGQALAVSVLLRPSFPADSFGWLPLVAGLAMTRAVEGALGGTAASVGLKWPNDVQVDGLKVSGLLAELLPSADGVVVGAGLNLSIPAESLPTPVSTSLVLHGGSPQVDTVLSRYLRELRDLYDLLAEHAGDAEASGIRRLVQERCTTIGQDVRVELPGGTTQGGVATGLDPVGRLLVSDRADGRVQAVAAGDVTHVRYE